MKKEVKLDELTNLKKHKTKDPISRFFLDNFLITLVAVIKPLAIKTILDVGSGEGFTLDRLQKEGIGERLEGVDSVKKALIAGKQLHPTLNLKEGNIYNLRYKDNSFDLVICTEVLEHLATPRKGLKELIRVSKRYILLTVPNEPWFTFSRIIRFKNLLRFGAHPEHIQTWSVKGFEDFIMKEKGVQMRKKRLPFPWTMVLLEKKS